MADRKFRFEKLFSNVFIFLFSAFIALIIIDKLSIKFLNHRKSRVEKQYSVQDIRSLKPYIAFKGAPFAKAWKHYSRKAGYTDNILNELGYPGISPKIPKPDNEYRIIVLGGSAAFMGNPPIPRLIQYQFEKNNCFDVKVYNFAVVSSVTSMELARLVFEVVNYTPDLIISYSGFNDIDEPFEADPRPGYPFNYFIYESNPIIDSDIRQYPLIPLMAYSSNLMRNFYPSYFLKSFTNIDKLRAEVDYDTGHWRQKIANIYVENMLKSQKISKAFGSEFIAFFQPSLYFKDFVNSGENKYLTIERMNNSLKIRKMILKSAKKAKEYKELNFVDLSDFFDNNHNLVFKDRVHVQYQFRPDIAIEVYKHILKLIRKNNPKNISNPLCLQPVNTPQIRKN